MNNGLGLMGVDWLAGWLGWAGLAGLAGLTGLDWNVKVEDTHLVSRL